MKNLIYFCMLAGSIMAATSASALVKLIADCSSADGRYKLVIMDNKGIGMERESHFVATLKNADDVAVGTYNLIKKAPAIGPTSFRHVELLDAATLGQAFSFAFPSTNTPYALRATLNDGETIAYGRRGEMGLNCQATE